MLDILRAAASILVDASQMSFTSTCIGVCVHITTELDEGDANDTFHFHPV